MLHDFVAANRHELIARCEIKAAKRSHIDGPAERHGVPLFLQQLVETLRSEHTKGSHPPDPEPTSTPTVIGRAAALHGAELLRRGKTVDQVVHDYGDICQAVTELAIEQNAPVTVDEFRTLNRCLDNAIADAVTAYTRADDLRMPRSTTLGEQRRLMDVAIATLITIKAGSVGLNGPTGDTLFDTLQSLRNLIDPIS